jgi:hypothetical protein
MNTQEQAREIATTHRHSDEHLQESMLSRTESEIENHSKADTGTPEQARELIAHERQHDEHLHETMLSRTESEIE